MIDIREDALTQAQADTRAAPGANDRGWYLYGITRRDDLGTTRLERGGGDGGEAALAVDPLGDDGEPVQMLDGGALAEIVRLVPLAHFSAEALRARGDDAAWIAALARRHNQVIAAIHERHAILPATFGRVYVRAEDVTTAVAGAQDALLAQLGRVEGCDEWAVHVYADHPAVQQRLVAEHPTMHQLQHELAFAPPGRAYFLRRKLADELATATDQVLSVLAQASYDHLARWAAAGQVNQLARSPRDAHGEKEILRAAFLVRRTSADTFLAELRSCVEGREGVRCAYSGPWPPYSFAVPIEEKAP